jgi:riboflavin synthase
MFTGIISGIGRIMSASALGHEASHGVRVIVEAPPGYLEDATLGDSFAINGACMTVAELDRTTNRFSVDVSAESLAKTSGLATLGDVNLEKALRSHERLGGHLVSGHVDGIGLVTSFGAVGESRELRILADRTLGRFLAYKGSITVNGVSLTVNRMVDLPEGCEVMINLIPHTLGATTLGGLLMGQHVNLEIDLIARYVERMMSAPAVNN